MQVDSEIAHANAPAIVARQGVGLPEGHCDGHIDDVATLNCEWYYNWTTTPELLSDSRYVPMLWGGYETSHLPEDYDGYVIVLNEPDCEWAKSGPASTYEWTPEGCAKRCLHLSEHYPYAKLIVGGVSQYGLTWLQNFVTALGDWRPYGWHMHAYVEWDQTSTTAWTWLQQARAACPGGEFWVTEFGCCNGNAVYAQNLITAMKVSPDWINRYAWFASRLVGDEWYVPDYWSNPTLLNAGTGVPTAYGNMYIAAGQ